MEEMVDLNKQREWRGEPGTVKIPEAYLKGLNFEIIAFVRKERGGYDISFRCRGYEHTPDGQWRFEGVIVDSSHRNAQGEIELAQYSYHPEIYLVDTAFMVYPKA